MAKRKKPSNDIIDQASLDNYVYNEAAGSRKSSEVGLHLIPIPTPAGLTPFTTDATTARGLPAGKCLAIYNNSATLYSVTLGEDSTIAALAAGVTDAGGHVGIPCTPNRWTKLACGPQTWVITQNVALLVFLVDDDSVL